MAEAGWIKPPRRAHRRSAVQGRDQANQTRRLKSPSPTFGHSSVVKRSGAEEILIFHDHLEASFSSGSTATGDKKCEVEVPVETPLPKDLEDDCLKVSVRLIEPVLRVADAIDFTAYPDAVPFAGKTVVGLVELPNKAGD